ncbi:MAG: cytochrome d ubiquinol oxidase subunit II [Candidatus Marsarchaeota archaeon]|nr:cytochrome d ubiquinol oxidase subunit II [Candidatus Marsarchaeota archaeon]
MSFMYPINYFIFSIFLTLFGLEAGVAVTMFLEYDKYKDRLKRFLMPLWEVTGTFGVFYLVNLEATVPSLLLLLGTVYVAPLLIAGVFFILRNAFLSYSEYMGNPKSEKLYLHVYAIATVLVAFIAISVLDSGISGIGINASAYSINIAKLFINSFNILMFIGIALLSVFLAATVFGIREYKWFTGAAAVLGIVAIAIATYSSLGYMFSNAFGFGLPYLIGLVILLAISLAFYYKSNRYAKYLSLLWFILAINFFGLMQNSMVLGGTVSVNSYIQTGTTAFYVDMVTLIGGIILVVSLVVLIYISYIKKMPNNNGGY